MKEIVVLCPANVVTGGPELLHQFVHELNSIGLTSKVLYYPFESNVETPEEYNIYNVPQIKLEQCNKENTYLVVPEVATDYVCCVNFKQVVVWWLSVDNYTKKIPKTLKSRLKWWVEKFVLKNSKPLLIDEMKNFLHLTQSCYAKNFLAKNGITRTHMLSDYLSSEHFCKKNILKENIVAYNPKKGVEFTSRIISKLDDIKFVPIQNMTATEVAQLLESSKVYIDFGEHPGKDRIPREAAMANAIVITGRKGSADYIEDVFIFDKYKFLESEKSIEEVGILIRDVFDNFDCHYDNFEDYRDKIRSEKSVFEEQVRSVSKFIFDV